MNKLEKMLVPLLMVAVFMKTDELCFQTKSSSYREEDFSATSFHFKLNVFHELNMPRKHMKTFSYENTLQQLSFEISYKIYETFTFEKVQACFGYTNFLNSNAVLCYSCDSSINPACHDLKNGEIKPVLCTPSKIGENVGGWLKEITKIDYHETTIEIQVPMQCLKITATNENGEKITFRGCQLDLAKSDMCAIIKTKAEQKQGVKITACKSCETDNCNGSEQHLLNKWSLIVPLSVLLILSKMSLA